MVKNLFAMQETWVQSWVGKIPWRREGLPSILAWRIPTTEEPGGLQSMGSQKDRHEWSDLARMHTHTHTHPIWSALFSVSGLPQWLSGRESACLWRRRKRHRFDPWVGKIPWRTKWQPTPVFLPGQLHGQRILEGYSPWGGKESDTTERAGIFGE